MHLDCTVGGLESRTLEDAKHATSISKIILIFFRVQLTSLPARAAPLRVLCLNCLSICAFERDHRLWRTLPSFPVTKALYWPPVPIAPTAAAASGCWRQPSSAQ